MEGLILRIFLHNWPQKVVAFLAAMTVWLVVHNSITATRVIANVPIRVINLPHERTVSGLQPNGLLSKTITLTLRGNGEILGQLDASDLEVVLDAANKPSRWVPRISAKNIVSQNPEYDLAHAIDRVHYNDFIIRLSRLITKKVPVNILPPIGDSPHGYQYLAMWPEKLSHTVSGPEEEVEKLARQGLDISFDLNAITTADLDKLARSQPDLQTDEIGYHVPGRWKQVIIPFLGNESQEINDPNATNLKIDFLKNDVLPIELEIPIRIFYPAQERSRINPLNTTLTSNNLMSNSYGVTTLGIPLFVRDVSRLYLDIVRNHLEIVVIAEPQDDRGTMHWSVEVIDPLTLEEQYVRGLLPHHNTKIDMHNPSTQERYLRRRFRDYTQKLQLYKSSNAPIELNIRLQGSSVVVRDITPNGSE